MRQSIRIILFTLLPLLFFEVNGQVLLPEFEKPIKLETLNSKAEESMPLPYLDGQNMYFVRTYVEGSMKQRSVGQEIWSSIKENGKWSEPTSLFEEANDRGNNAVIGTSKDGNTVYVFNSIQTRRKLAKGIAYTKRGEDGRWSELKKIEIPGFEVGNGFYSFYINPSEDVILISMPASDSTFNEDLFVSLKKDNQWTPIRSLGSNINTELIETSPYIANDGKTLYFASSGHDGLGQTDIFVSYRQNESWTEWTKPLNLGEPINSTAFDSYFILGNNQEVYFASNRESKYSDIYYTKFTKKVKKVGSAKNLVLAQFNYKGLPAEGVKLKIVDENGNVIDEVVTDEYGKFSYSKLNPYDTYIVELAAEDVKEYPDGKIYFVEENGKLKGRYTNLADGSFSESTDRSLLKIKEESIRGVYNYKKLPLSNSALVVLDDSGFPIDTIYTNEEGVFEYNKLSQDVNYTLKPLDQPEEPEEVNLYLVNQKGEKIRQSKSMDEMGFAFEQVAERPKKAKQSTNVIMEKETIVETRKVDDSGKISETSLPIKETEIAETIQFDFNSFYLNEKGREDLKKWADKMEKNQTMKILLKGHTDTSGTDPINDEISLKRATSSRKYLISLGITKERIDIMGVRDKEPIASNANRSGRIKNRRVEVIIQSK